MATLKQILNQQGRLPWIGLRILPVDADGSRSPVILPSSKNGVIQSGFLAYTFDQNIIVPVDGFSFTFACPADKNAYDLVRDGDMVQIITSADDAPLATGIIDAIEITVNPTDGERITIHGRDMVSQLEDQTAISAVNSPFWMERTTVRTVLQSLCQKTRIQTSKIILDQAPTGSYLFQSEPGESKLSALLRFLEPLNCLVWVNGDGDLTVGRPNFYQASRGRMFMVKSQAASNILSCRVVRNSTQIPNIVLPIFAGQELAQTAVAQNQQLLNSAVRPSQLRRAGHLVPKTVVVSHPSGLDANYVNTIEVFNASTKQQTNKVLTSDSTAANSLFIQQWAKREIARKNMEELMIDIDVPGHFGDDGLPYLSDECWDVEIERASVDEKMYCYAVKYRLEEGVGQMTTLSFCKLNTIVADSIAP